MNIFEDINNSVLNAGENLDLIISNSEAIIKEDKEILKLKNTQQKLLQNLRVDTQKSYDDAIRAVKGSLSNLERGLQLVDYFEQIEIFIGDQEDRIFLKELAERIPRIDILIDDGGHEMKQQINTFEVLFPHIDKNGVYLCEDMHTSYWPKFGGGYKKRSTFIEYSKNFIDSINAWHSVQPNRLSVTEFTRSVDSLHYYDSILVIEKRPIKKPFELKTGTKEIPNYHRPKSLFKRSKKLFKRGIKSLARF